MPVAFKHLLKDSVFNWRSRGWTYATDFPLDVPCPFRVHYPRHTRVHKNACTLIEKSPPSEISLFLPPYFLLHCSAANSGFRGWRGCTCEIIYARADTCTSAYAVAIVCAHRARVLRADAERKINIKFTSRLRIHVDHEPRS